MRRLLCIGALLLALALSACTVDSGTVASFDAAPSEESGLDSATVSREGTEDESVELYAELCEKVRALLVLDKRVTDVFANGALAEEVDAESTEFGVYYRLTEGSKLLYYDSVVALLDEVYTVDSPARDGFLNSCPAYGQNAVIKGNGGYTEVCFNYNARFHPDIGNAKIRYIATEGDRSFFEYTDEEYSLDISVLDTEKGLRLENSLYFYEREYQKGLPWRQDTAVENSGSCTTLMGNCLIINVFANDSDSFWTAADMQSCNAMLTEGLEFLVDSSVGYGVTGLRFETVSVTLSVADALDSSVGSTYADIAFENTEYEDIIQFTSTHAAGKDYQNVCVLFHFNKHGRSYFVQCDGDYSKDETAYYEYGVLFFSDRSEGEYFSCPAVYAHELLHAFGAKDLYEGTVTENGNLLAEALFASDLMRYEPVEIYKSLIGPLTAKLIGWETWLDPQLKAVLDECL